jgi:hypothetical protein
MRAHLVINDAACAAEFTQRVEVAEGRKIRVSGIVLRSRRKRSRPRQQRLQRTEKDQLRPAPGRGDADVEPHGTLPIGLGEEGIAPIDAWRRKDGGLGAPEQIANLGLRSPDRSGRRDDLRSAAFAVDLARREQVEGGLI